MVGKLPRMFPDEQRTRFVAGQTNTGGYMVRKLGADEHWSKVTAETFHDHGVHVATLCMGTWFVLADAPEHQNHRNTPRLHWITSPIAKDDKEHLNEIVKHQCVRGHVRCGSMDPYAVQGHKS